MAVGWGADLMREFLEVSPVIPVVEIEDPAMVRRLGEALLSGGIGLVEVTLRTPRALDAISELASLPDMIVGAGTLISGEDVRAAKDAGAAFGVSPGSTDVLIDAIREEGLPFLPGAATPSEVTKLASNGFTVQKLFPAEVAGGVPMLKALAGPFQSISFCPTGGITQANAPEYLQLPNVICVGGSWVATKEMISQGAWGVIEKNAKAARLLA